MSDKEFKSYRFDDSGDPSDEMLRCLMQKVARNVAEENRLGETRYFENLKKEAMNQRRSPKNG